MGEAMGADMDLREFAARHRLRIQRVSDDMTDIIPGREGHSHIFEYASGFLAVMVMPDGDTAHRWIAARSAFVVAGMTINQDGDCEGTAVFTPTNIDQVLLALRYAKIRSRRRISERQKNRLKEIGFKSDPVRPQNNFSTTVRGELTP
jgi:hypothetical protein